jgi:3-methylfumaryl-CoA hydratase
MTTLITPEIRKWIGHSEAVGRIEVTRRDIVKYAVATEQRLDKYKRGDEAPPMFLFGAVRAIAPLDELGPDGLPKQTLLPDLPLKRVMAGGTKTKYHRPVKPGDVLVGTYTLTDIYEKQGSSGPLIFVVYKLEIETESGEPIVEETQTRIVR